MKLEIKNLKLKRFNNKHVENKTTRKRKNITVLFFGDIMGKIGRQALQKIIPRYQKKYRPDLIIANVENLAHGKSITPSTLQEITDAGVQFFTSGNHIFKKPQAEDMLNDNKIPLIRPANYPLDTVGVGYRIINIKKYKLLIANLLGQVFIESEPQATNPFLAMDKILKENRNKINGAIVDIHAEATSEKVALGLFLDGRVSAVFGTHTHIPTADCKILAKGTAYCTDIGMVGAKDSVIGLEKNNIIENYLESSKSQKPEIPEKGDCTVNALILTINPQTKKAVDLKRLDAIIKI